MAHGAGQSAAKLSRVDEGPLISYEVLEKDVPVYAAGGAVVGKVDHVVAAPELDIFHGIVMRTDGGRRFVPADKVVALHEHGVDLRLDEAAAAALPEPHGAAPVWRDNVQVVLRIKTSISPEARIVGRSLALIGRYLTLFASLKIAAASARHSSTSRPL